MVLKNIVGHHLLSTNYEQTVFSIHIYTVEMPNKHFRNYVNSTSITIIMHFEPPLTTEYSMALTATNKALQAFINRR